MRLPAEVNHSWDKFQTNQQNHNMLEQSSHEAAYLSQLKLVPN